MKESLSLNELSDLLSHFEKELGVARTHADTRTAQNGVVELKYRLQESFSNAEKLFALGREEYEQGFVPTSAHPAYIGGFTAEVLLRRYGFCKR